MLLCGKLTGSTQLGTGRHRWRAVPPASLTAGHVASSPERRAVRDTAAAADRALRREKSRNGVGTELERRWYIVPIII